jgi:hypothetical protein
MLFVEEDSPNVATTPLMSRRIDRSVYRYVLEMFEKYAWRVGTGHEHHRLSYDSESSVFIHQAALFQNTITPGT